MEAVAGKVEGLEAGHGQAGDAGQLQGGCVNVLKRVCSRDVRLMLTRLGLKRQVMDRLVMQDSCRGGGARRLCERVKKSVWS